MTSTVTLSVFTKLLKTIFILVTLAITNNFLWHKVTEEQ